MKFDVSELKTLQECGRKWQLSSRNAFHLRPKVPKDSLFFGALFHECLATMYLGGDLDKIVAQAVRELQGDLTLQKTIERMLRGYYDEVLRDDLAHYVVMDIEHSVNLDLPELWVINPETGEIDEEASVHVVGSVDMVCIDKATLEVWYFEHKTCSKFRPDVYFTLDEQPRTYFLDLLKYVERLNEGVLSGKLYTPTLWAALGLQERAVPLFKVGGVYINEVKKLVTKFEYMRRPCKYGEAQCANFYKKLLQTGRKLISIRDGYIEPCAAPGYMSCSMCDFASICTTYGYQDVDKELLLEEFAEEFEVREVDHLDEKAERRIEG